jgi:hypothetical protein
MAICDQERGSRRTTKWCSISSVPWDDLLQITSPNCPFGNCRPFVRPNFSSTVLELLHLRQCTPPRGRRKRCCRCAAAASPVRPSAQGSEPVLSPALTAHPDWVPREAICGVGPITAARFLGEAGDPRRFRFAAAFAMACGAAPIPASSGKTQRVRLNRRGNRQLNRALFIVAFTQLHGHEPACAYVERKRAGGKSWKEAMRCLKRHLANVVYRAMLEDRSAGLLTT